MARHIFFIAPEEPRPTGGINVMFQFAAILKDHGIATSVHFESPDFVYEYYDKSVGTTYSPVSRPAGFTFGGLKSRYRRYRQERSKPRRPGANRRLLPDRDDLIVIPEFWYSAQAQRFPGIPHVVLSQAYTTTLEMVIRHEVRDGLASSHRGYIATSAICESALRPFTAAPVHHVPLFLDSHEHGYVEKKDLAVSYMPRRRTAEAATVVDILRNSDALEGFRFVKIDGMQPAEVKDVLARSLIFLAFSEREGFGLPPAEAMAHGCIVVGYTGVGGREYFSPDTAFPIPEDDTVAFIETAIAVARAYTNDPAPLDALRRRASRKVLGTYTKEKTTAALLKAVAELAK